MVSIVEENVPQKFSNQFAQQIGSGLGQGIGKIPEMLAQRSRMSQENEALKKLGIDLGGVSDPELRKIALTQALKQKDDKNIDQTNILKGVKGAVQSLRDLASKTGIGLLGNFSPSDEARYNRGKFGTLKSELLSYYKTLFPRGITQGEFKRFESDYIPHENDSKSRINGKLDAYEELIQKKLEEHGSASGDQEVGKTWVISPTGKRVQIPSDQVKAALASGGKLG